MSNRPGESGPEKKGRKTNAPVASPTPSPSHERVSEDARRKLGNTLPDFQNEPRGIGNQSTEPELPPTRNNDKDIDVEALLKDPEIGRKKIRRDPDEIDPDKAFESNQEELLGQLERAASDHLPIPKPLPKIPKQPVPFRPAQKPARRPTTKALKRRQLVDRLNREPSTAQKALAAIWRGLKKINPFS